MRLHSAWISDYKNLKDFSITFEDEGFIDIFVGKNGSGKSNFLEALIEIFDHIYSEKPGKAGPGFDYEITYSIGGTETRLGWRNDSFSVNGRAGRQTLGQTPAPDHVLVYYSGQNDQVADLVQRYERRFRDRLRDARNPISPEIIGIGPSCKKLQIVTILMLPEDSAARQMLCGKLGILGASRSLELSLSSPFYVTRAEHDPLDPNQLFWGVDGYARTFLQNLLDSIEGEFTPGQLYDRSTFQYNLTCNIDQLRDALGDNSGLTLFRSLEALRVLGMLHDIRLRLTLEGLESSYLNLFSDGQFQSVYLFGIAELFRELDCVALLDEPDAFLHPEWQFEFLDQLDEISPAAAQTNHILMSSHSAATLIQGLQPQIKFFDVRPTGEANCYDLLKRVAIKKLSSNLIRYTEEEQLLSMMNAIQIENKPVLFTEGSIDPVIITEAWNRNFDSEIPFIPFYAFSCTYLSQLLRDDRIINEMDGKPMFGLFDLDQALNQWNGLNGEIVQPDLDRGKCKKLTGRAVFAFLLPVPENETIRAQVLKPDGGFFGWEALCEIEHLFYGDAATEEFFESVPASGGGQRIAIKSDAQKTRFAKEVIPTLDDRYFRVFKPMFEFMIAKIEGA